MSLISTHGYQLCTKLSSYLPHGLILIYGWSSAHSWLAPSQLNGTTEVANSLSGQSLKDSFHLPGEQVEEGR
jgi:hypothetical protein